MRALLMKPYLVSVLYNCKTRCMCRDLQYSAFCVSRITATILRGFLYNKINRFLIKILY